MTSSSGDVFVSAGEVSGDHYIARITEILRARGHDGEVVGLCGSESIVAGARSLWRSERLQILGISEAIGSIRDILRLKREMVSEVISRAPRALVLVDSPDFNLPLVKSLRRAGYRGRVFYISPPSVWAWRSYRVKALKEHIDVCLPLFDFEHEYLLSAGCCSHWIGHPFVEELGDLHPDADAIRASISGPRPEGRIVALLPGSRGSEIRMLRPILDELCSPLEELGCSPVFSIAPGLSERTADEMKQTLERAGRRYFTGPGRELLAACECAIGSSGTATAQALLLRRFMVVLYKLSPISALIGRLVLRNRFFAVPNLLAGELFYPELMQGAARADRAYEAVMIWLGASDDERLAMRGRMDQLAQKMGRPGVLDLWADSILSAVS